MIMWLTWQHRVGFNIEGCKVVRYLCIRLEYKPYISEIMFDVGKANYRIPALYDNYISYFNLAMQNI